MTEMIRTNFSKRINPCVKILKNGLRIWKLETRKWHSKLSKTTLLAKFTTLSLEQLELVCRNRSTTVLMWATTKRTSTWTRRTHEQTPTWVLVRNGWSSRLRQLRTPEWVCSMPTHSLKATHTMWAGRTTTSSRSSNSQTRLRMEHRVAILCL